MYFILGSSLVAMGLASRHYAAVLPEFVARYAGDTLWAAMVFIGIGFLAPSWSSFRVAIVALALSYLIEGSQLYHAPWIESLRYTPGIGLVLGYGFLWSDLVCYTAGVALGLVLERAVSKQ